VDLRQRIDSAFRSWGCFVCAHRYSVLAVCIMIVATLGSFLPWLRAENSSQSYLHSDDPASLEYEEFQRQFGQDDRVMIAVKTPEVFDPVFLERLRALHEELEEVLPHVDEVKSLINVRQTRGEADTLIVEDLMEEWPETPQELDDLRGRVFASPLYVDNVISRDGLLTTVTIRPVVYSGEGDGADSTLGGFDAPEAGTTFDGSEGVFLSEDEKRELVEAVWPVVKHHAGPDFELHVVGGAVVAAQITGRMTRDTHKRVAATALAIVVFLFLLFRRATGVIYPMAVVAAAMIATLGSLVLLDIPFSIVLGMLPVFTLCVAVCYAIHVLVLVYQELAEGVSREQAIVYAFGHAGLAIVMASLTTAAGMLSFLTAALAPVRHLGIAAPVGVFFSFFFSLTLLPALVVIFPLPARAVGVRDSGPSWAQRLLLRAGDLGVDRPRAVLAAALLLMAVSVVGLAQIRFAHMPIEWLPAEDPVRIASELIDRELRGSSTAEVLIETGRENGLQDPETLRGIEAAIEMVESLDRGVLRVGKAMSLVDIVKETHQALNANDAAFYRIPSDRRLLAQELLLFENSGSDDLENFTDSQFQQGRVRLRLPHVDSVLYRDFLEEIKETFAGRLGDEVPITVTGRSALGARTFSALIDSMARSYIFALVLITPLMILLIGNVRLGLISMAPNLLPVFLILAGMGLFDIPLDASSMMVGGIIIGLAVDYTIHILHRFQTEFELSGDIHRAVRETLRTTGTALFFTTLVLTTGFTTMAILGTMQNTIRFGYLSALGIAIAFVANVLFTPALVALTKRFQGPTRAA
jgi:predicted RND superfamily exporter protein